MGVYIQTIHKQWGVFRPVGVSTVFEHIIGEFTDCLKIRAFFIDIYNRCFTTLYRGRGIVFLAEGAII